MQAPRDFLGKKIWMRAGSATMADHSPESNEAVARRLMILQEAAMPSSTQTAFALKVGIEVKRWNNFLRGMPLPREPATILVKAFPGITFEWLWFGKLDGVPMRLQQELEAAGKRITMSASKARAKAGAA